MALHVVKHEEARGIADSFQVLLLKGLGNVSLCLMIACDDLQQTDCHHLAQEVLWQHLRPRRYSLIQTRSHPRNHLRHLLRYHPNIPRQSRHQPNCCCIVCFRCNRTHLPALLQHIHHHRYLLCTVPQGPPLHRRNQGVAQHHLHPHHRNQEMHSKSILHVVCLYNVWTDHWHLSVESTCRSSQPYQKRVDLVLRL